MSPNLSFYKKAITFSVLAVLAAAITVSIVQRNRAQAIERLFQEAAGYTPYFRDSKRSLEAARRLAKYRNERTDELLLQLALGQGPFVSPETREEALRSLRGRTDPVISETMAKSLQPHVGLRTREAIGTALSEMTCDDECIRSILHYLERISRGDLNEEDRAIFPPGAEDLQAEQTKEETVLYQNLRRILEKHEDSTLNNLMTIYGLGSDNPSKFALDLVSQMHYQQACPLLIRSKELLGMRSTDVYRGPAQEINATIASINCK